MTASHSTRISGSEESSAEWNHAANQGAEYGLARLGSVQAATHAIGSIREGHSFTIQWYDRQGILSTNSINIYEIDNLPLYLAFLFIIQRFDLADWGTHPDFPVNPADATIIVDGKKFRLGKDVLHKQWGIQGRSTSVIECLEVVDHMEPRSCVVKVSFPEESRRLEHDLVDEAKRRGDGDSRVDHHIPEYVAHQEYKETSTSKIRRFLGLPLHTITGSRRMYAIVLIKLDGTIRMLKGKDYWRVWWDCFECHFALWKTGFRHRDISDTNLMYRNVVGSGKVGVLSDFDLSSLESERGRNTERIGTFPFMACELLSSAGLEGKIRHEYHHDAESFFWVAFFDTALYPKEERDANNEHVSRVIKAATGRLLPDDFVFCKQAWISYGNRHVTTLSQKVCWDGFLKIAYIWWTRSGPGRHFQNPPTNDHLSDDPDAIYQQHIDVRRSYEASHRELSDDGERNGR